MSVCVCVCLPQQDGAVCVCVCVPPRFQIGFVLAWLRCGHVLHKYTGKWGACGGGGGRADWAGLMPLQLCTHTQRERGREREAGASQRCVPQRTLWLHFASGSRVQLDPLPLSPLPLLLLLSWTWGQMEWQMITRQPPRMSSGRDCAKERDRER